MAKTQPGPVAQRVRETARRRGIPQAALAEAIGRTQQNVSRRLDGQVEITVDEAMKFAEVLDVPPAWLLLGEASGAEPWANWLTPAPDLESV